MNLTDFLERYFDLDLLQDFKKIYVLVSGGVDSTLLAHVISAKYPNKTYFVNCYNPYENSPTLDWYKKQPNFILIKSAEEYNYKNILMNAFQSLNEAACLRQKGKYHKKVFGCCRIIKHDAFKKDPLFKEENTVVISGIKQGDGTQRRIWLTQLSKGCEPNNQSEGNPTYFHKHKEGQLYCYPFRDFTKRDFPQLIMDKLSKHYPKLKHSGCAMCPVLILFKIQSEEKRYWDSVAFARKYCKPSKLLLKYNPHLQSPLEGFF